MIEDLSEPLNPPLVIRTYKTTSVTIDASSLETGGIYQLKLRAKDETTEGYNETTIPMKDTQYTVPIADGPSSIRYVGGDGQAGITGQAPASSLRVRVSNGLGPVENAEVKFEVEEGDGTFSETKPMTTDSNGLAECHWTLGASGA